ncbi:MAG: CPBP family intramembrane glutamic endopeptidase [Gemmatimonadales bacterium]
MRLVALAEGGLVLAALALGAWTGVAPFAAVGLTWGGLGWGIAATVPLLLGLRWCLQTPLPPVVRLVGVARTRIAPLFAGSTLLDLALVSALAGLGEELLFRGVIQTALGVHLPHGVAVALTAALFGLAHCITPTYAVLATLVGAYLGWTFLASGNLLTPIVAHALYDLVALALLVRVKPEPLSSVL